MGVVRRRGLTSSQLYRLSWILGVLAVAGWVRFANLFDDQPFGSREQAIWLGVAVLSGTYSAACLILCGLKTQATR